MSHHQIAGWNNNNNIGLKAANKSFDKLQLMFADEIDNQNKIGVPDI
jgi:hypothetical protein